MKADVEKRLIRLEEYAGRRHPAVVEPMLPDPEVVAGTLAILEAEIAPSDDDLAAALEALGSGDLTPFAMWREGRCIGADAPEGE